MSLFSIVATVILVNCALLILHKPKKTNPTDDETTTDPFEKGPTEVTYTGILDQGKFVLSKTMSPLLRLSRKVNWQGDQKVIDLEFRLYRDNPLQYLMMVNFIQGNGQPGKKIFKTTLVDTEALDAQDKPHEINKESLELRKIKHWFDFKWKDVLKGHKFIKSKLEDEIIVVS